METKNKDWSLSNRAFWGMIKRCNMSEDDAHATIAMAYPGRVSTTELKPYEINALTRALNDRLLPDAEKEKEKWRRMLMGVVRKWCEQNGYRTDFEYVCNVASRGERHINRMSLTDLRARYHAFLKMGKEMDNQTLIKNQLKSI